MLRKFFHDEEGATAMEYGVIVALMTIALIVSITFVGGANNSAYGEWTKKVNASLVGGGGGGGGGGTP